MEINKTDGVKGPGGIEPARIPKPSAVPPQTPASPPRTDQVDISRPAQLISQITSMPGIRKELVEQLRQEIQSGKYETPERLEEAIDKFLGEQTDLI